MFLILNEAFDNQKHEDKDRIDDAAAKENEESKNTTNAIDGPINKTTATTGSDGADAFFFNAMFAIFALYTIYQTNPLPSIPIPGEDSFEQNKSSQQMSGNTAARKKWSESDLQDDCRVLSTLTIGQNNDKAGQRTCRRSYQASIRISREIYSLIIRLRDLALGRIDSCQQRRLYCLQ